MKPVLENYLVSVEMRLLATSKEEAMEKAIMVLEGNSVREGFFKMLGLKAVDAEPDY